MNDACNCDQALELGAELGEAALLLGGAAEEIRRLSSTPTLPAPPPNEVTEYATVRSVDAVHGVVTLEVKLPIERNDLPAVDDEVRVSWLLPEDF